MIRSTGPLSLLGTLVVLGVLAGDAVRAQTGSPRPVESMATVSGVLKGAMSTHDGETSWNAFVSGGTATYLIVGTMREFNELKKLAGKRVTVKGRLVTEVRQPDGTVLKLAGTAGGIRYDGNLTIAALGDVVLHPVTELTGTVEEAAEGTPSASRMPARIFRLNVAGEKRVTYTASDAAGKKLKDFVGKPVVVRCYVTGETIDHIDSVAAAKEPAKKPGRGP